MSVGLNYFNCLTNEQRVTYKLMLSGITKYLKEFSVPPQPDGELSAIFNYLLLDNPSIFYVPSFMYSNDTVSQKCLIRPRYSFERDFINRSNHSIHSFLQTFDALRTKSETEKELYVHDYCLNNIAYEKTSDDAYTILSPILNKTAVCEGIAKLAKLIFDYLGVESLIVAGKASSPVNGRAEGHAWNIVKINGNTYHLDITFDLTLKTDANRYDYFNLCDDDIKKDHQIIGNVPACITADNDYFSVNALTASSLDEYEKFILDKLTQGYRRVYVKLKNVKHAEKIVDTLEKTAANLYVNAFKRDVAVGISCNLSQMVFELDFK